MTRIKIGKGTSEKSGTVNSYDEKVLAVTDKVLTDKIVQSILSELKIKDGWLEVIGIKVKTAKSEQK